jgi:fucose permease
MTHTNVPHRFGLLVLICAIFLAAGVVLSGLGPALPFLAARSGHEVAALGGLFTALASGVVIAQFIAGPAGARFGLRAVLGGGMALAGGGAAIVSLSASLFLMLATAVVVGIGFGGVLAAGNILIARLFADHSAAALNGVNVFFGVGSIAGPAIAGMAGARLGTPQAGLWVGAATLLLLAPVAFGRPKGRTASEVAAPTTSQPPQVGTLWLLGALLLVYVGTEVGFGGWSTVYLTASASLTPAAAALGASGFWLALTVGRVLGTVLGMRLTPQALLMGSLLGMFAGASVLLAGVGSEPVSIAGVLLLGLACGPVFPTVLALAATATQSSAAVATRLLAVGNGGGLVIPALLGVLLTQYGPAAMAGLVLGATITMVALCAMVMLSGSARPRPAVPPLCEDA